jgi:geranylgeranyl pyrophosphate synthase
LIRRWSRFEIPVLHGHVLHIDTEWALTSISQVQFWRPGTLQRYGNDLVRGILSVDISDWNSPGLGGIPATECTRQQVFDEVWAQLQRSLNSKLDTVLSDDDLVGWFLDPDITPDRAHPTQLTNKEPLLVNLADTWRLRPDATTAIPNLFLASDYVRTYTDLATMEAANEAARRSVNGILDASGHPGPPCELWPLTQPPILAPLREHDASRFRQGLPWDSRLLEIATSAVPTVGPPFDRVTDVVANMVGLDGSNAHPIALALGASDLLDLAGGGETDSTSPVPPAPGFAHSRARRADDSGPADSVDRMSWYRRRALEAIHSELPTTEPQRDLYDLIRGFVSRPSKGLRPGLCLATCGAFGGQLEDAIWSAAGLEMLHSAFVVHDDIEDESDYRSGLPALHRRVGTAVAINVGDGMNALAMRLFRRNSDVVASATTGRIFEEVDHLLLETLEGQALELGWMRYDSGHFGVDDYLRLVLKKTGWYSFIHPMRIGALIAQPGDADLDRFNRLGCFLGMAFQIQDDVLNLTGSRGSYGKTIGGDLSEGKRTLVLGHALATAGPTQREKIQSFLALPGRKRLSRQVAVIHETLSELGSIDWARQAAQDLVSAAQKELPRALSGAHEGPDLDFIRHLVHYVVDRQL